MIIIFTLCRQSTLFSVQERPGGAVLGRGGRDPQHPADAAAGGLLLHPLLAPHTPRPRPHDPHLPLPLRQPLAAAEQLGLGNLPQPVAPDLPDQLRDALPRPLHRQHQRRLAQAGGRGGGGAASLPSTASANTTKFDTRYVASYQENNELHPTS